ncbi:MAG: O-antigen ligase family protein [Clostridia bacterium]|nr:O-antigen ligase family protein [Clostridia bacterium]
MAQNTKKQTSAPKLNTRLQVGFDKASCIILLFFALLPTLYIPIYYGNGDTWINDSSIFTYLGGIAALLVGLTYIITRFSADRNWLGNSLKAKPWLICLLIAGVWAFISCLLAENVSVAFWGHDHRRDGFFLLLCYLGVMGTALILKNRQYKNILLRVLILAAVPVVAVMLAQYFGDAYTTISNGSSTSILKNTKSSVFLNSNHLGYYQAITLAALSGMICWDFFNTKISPKARLIWEIGWLVLLIFFSWCLIINNTFGAYLAVLIGLAFTALIFTVKASHLKLVKRLFFWVPLVLFLITTLVICFGFSSTQAAKNFNRNFNSLSLDLSHADLSETLEESKPNKSAYTGNKNAYARLLLWQFSWQMIEKEPVFGYGADSISSILTAAEFNNSDQDRPHNEYLQYATYYGLPFLALLLAGLILLFLQQLFNLKYKKLSQETLIALGALLTYWASAFVGVAIFNTAIYAFILIGLAAASPTQETN